MRNIHNTALRAAGTFMLLMVSLLFAAAQPPEPTTPSAPSIIIEDIATLTAINNKYQSQQTTKNSHNLMKPAAAVNITVTAYPNPVVNYINIDTQDPENYLQKLDLYDANGRLWVSQSPPTGYRAQLDMSSLPPGYYYLRASTAKGTQTLPISKQ